MTSPITNCLSALAALTPAERQRLIRRAKDAGLLPRWPRGERLPARNARIAAKKAAGLSHGQIAIGEGMTRSAVKQVLRRRRQLWMRCYSQQEIGEAEGLTKQAAHQIGQEFSELKKLDKSAIAAAEKWARRRNVPTDRV